MGITCQLQTVKILDVWLTCAILPYMGARVGDTSRTAAVNMVRFRSAAGLSLRELSAELAERGVTITAQSLSAVEHGKTAVTVDLLTALAAVLGVSPSTLLMPYTEDGFEPPAKLAGTDETYPISMYEWLTGTAPLGLPINTADIDPRTVTAFRDRSQPKWLREKD